MTVSTISKHRLRYFILGHVFIFLLLASWLFPPTRMLWDGLDEIAFRFLNGTILPYIPGSLFWAMANQKKADLVMWAMIMTITFWSIFSLKTSEERRYRFAELLFGMIFLVIAIAVTRNLTRAVLGWLEWSRTGPSLIYKDAIRLSALHPDIKMKDASVDSFPGDHGIVILVWAGLIIAFAGGKFAFTAIIAACLVCLPRLVAGAHWLSDNLVGSLAMATFILTWALATPLKDFFVYSVDKGLQKITQLRFFCSRKKCSHEQQDL